SVCLKDISVLGPTFEDLALNVKKNISNISYIFIGRAGGYIGGSLIGGVLFDCMNPHLLLGFSMILTALGMYAIPFCKQAALLTAFMVSIGVSMGVLDTGETRLRKRDLFSICPFTIVSDFFITFLILFQSVEKVSPAPETAFNLKSSLKSMWAYIVIGSFLFLVSFLFFLLYSRCGTVKDQSHSGSGKQLVAKHHLALVFLLFLFFFAYVGAEVAYGSFIFTFAKDFSHMPEAQAAGLNSLFWGTFAATRGFAIFFATCMYPGTMILLCLLGSTLSSLLLCLFSNHKVALWVCTGVYGASMATTFPSGISWLEQYTTITGHTAAAFVVGAALGEMVLPALVGFLLGRFPNQPLLMYLSLLTSTFTAIIFPVMYKLASAPGSPGRKPRVERQIEADDTKGF
uniref:Major facilitator superfamily domain containing 4B n=1 Tax=Oryzias sinensis TaxID=183150 RepID=A0A8C7X800_9TELE